MSYSCRTAGDKKPFIKRAVPFLLRITAKDRSWKRNTTILDKALVLDSRPPRPVTVTDFQCPRGAEPG
jgi:hypothetical protein